MKQLFDRDSIAVKPLSERKNKLDVVRDSVEQDHCTIPLSGAALADVEAAAEEIRSARKLGAPVILAFGAHSIKNGLSKLLIRLMEGDFVTHFATNGAGVIHDWEFAFQGMTGEDVRRYVAEGQFGIWEETGTYINLALALGARDGLGYGESVGRMVLDEGLKIPGEPELSEDIGKGAAPAAGDSTLGRAAGAADLKGLLRYLRKAGHELPDPKKGGFLAIPHPWKEYSLSAAAYRAGIPFTCHPMFGHDIIYTHPANRGAPIGRTAEPDFLSFADSVSKLENGVYLSVGSAIMSPMIFEKALSMSRNLKRQKGESIENFSIHVVDLAASAWDWTREGEPPQDNPAYYLRFCKTFSRMGGRMTYASADNRAWLSALARALGA
jgi:hypothetical protein